MLKFIFWSLLAGNAALLGMHYDYFITPVGGTAVHVPVPLQPDKLTLIPASQAIAPQGSLPDDAPEGVGMSTGEPEAAATSGKIVACTELGPFSAEEAKRFEASLASLALGERQSRRNVQEVASYMVFIPSQGSKEAADIKAEELRRLGIKDFYVIQDNSALRWGISLGVFKTEPASKNHLANLVAQGVRSAQLGARNVSSSKILFQLRKLDEETMDNLVKITTDFPDHDLHACK